jgi:hypothetical protein
MVLFLRDQLAYRLLRRLMKSMIAATTIMARIIHQ